jgi:tetratricopeptide (TPR) repeat protein
LDLNSERVLLQEVLAEAPVELSAPPVDLTRCQTDNIRALLDRLTACNSDQVRPVVPAVQIAEIWLKLALGATGGDLPQGWELELLSLTRSAGDSLWQPAQAWVYRALVWAERRDLLALILPEQGPLTLPQADAWLEAAFLAGQGWEKRLAECTDHLPTISGESGAFPEAVSQFWWELIRLESQMAAGWKEPQVPSIPEIEERLVDLSRQIQEIAMQPLAGSTGQNTSHWVEKELRRLAGRTLAALVRARLDMDGGDGGALRSSSSSALSPAASWLPGWELAYLKGLAAWQRADLVHNEYAGQSTSRDAAEASLVEALEENPNSTPVKYALAIFISERHSRQNRVPGEGTGLVPEGGTRPEERALELLSSCLPTYPVRVARAGLLARLGCYSEAQVELNSGQESPLFEGMRYLWPRALEQARRQEALLRTALAERTGDSSQAMLFLKKAFDGDEQVDRAIPAGLLESRQAFSAWVELEEPLRMARSGSGIPAHEENAWRKRVVRQRLEKGRQELVKISAVANPDVLFFRAVVLTDFDPTLASRHIKTLLQRRPWIEKELQVGGGRVLWLADAALKLGQFELAQYAYDLLKKAGLPAIKNLDDPSNRLIAKRQALARLSQVLVSEDLTSEVACEKFERAVSEVTDAWVESYLNIPYLMSAIGSILCGDHNIETYLARARQSGVGEDICQALDSLASGKLSPNLSIESLKQFPEAVRPLLVFYCGQASEQERIRTFFDWAGSAWTLLTPVDPQRIAATVVHDFVRQQQYDQALSWVQNNLRSSDGSDGEQWAGDLEAWIRLHWALWLGRQGKLDAAEEILRGLERDADIVRKIGKD